MKRLAALMMALVLAAACCPMGALAAAPGSRLEGVDYTRIDENESLSKKVTITIGDRVFTGTLSNGKNLSEDEVDDIIRGVMTEYWITSGQLIGAKKRMDEAFKYDKSRYVQPAAVGEFILAASGISNARDLSQMATGQKAFPSDASFWVDLLAGTALNKLFDMALGLVTPEGFSDLLGAAQAAADVGMRELLEYMESEEKLKQALAGALALEEFYAICNSRIKDAEKESGLNQWSLTCAQTVTAEKTLFDIGPVTQYWRLTCDLKRGEVPENQDPLDYSGTYTGGMVISIWHDLSSFDEGFLSRFYLSSRLPFAQYSGYLKRTDEYSHGSVLTKGLTSSDLTLTLDANMGDTEKPFSLAGFEDETFFWSMHPIKNAFDYSYWQDGQLEYSGSGASVSAALKYNHYFAGELDGNNRGVRMDIYGWDMVNTGTFSAPYWSESYDDGESGTQRSTIARDTQIFSDLRIVPVLTIEGGG